MLIIRIAFPVFLQNVGYSKQTIEEKLGYVPRPKRPLTPYLRYIAQVREQLKQENPGFRSAEIIKMAAKKWELIEPNLKIKLEDEYKKEHQVYMRQKIEYNKNVTPHQKEDIKLYRANLEEMRVKRDLKKVRLSL